MTGNIDNNSLTFHAFKNQKEEILASISLSDIKYKNEFDVMISSFNFNGNSTQKKETATFTSQPNTETPVVEKNVTNQPAYLIAVYSKNGKNYIDVDYVSWLSGDASIKTKIADGVCVSINNCEAFPNGYKQNLNPKIRSLEVSPSASINVSGIINGTLNSYSTNSLSISFNVFEGAVSKLKPYLLSKPSFKDPLDFITIDVKENIVTKIVEPYQE